MTLDEALDAFTANPSYETAVALIKEANQYWQDGMIEDSTFAKIIEPTIAFLTKS